MQKKKKKKKKKKKNKKNKNKKIPIENRGSTVRFGNYKASKSDRE